MIKIVARSGNLSSLLKSTTSVGASSVVPIVPAHPVDVVEKTPTLPIKLTNYSASTCSPSGKIRVLTGPAVNFSVRYAHTDLKVPDYTPYRKEQCKNPNRPTRVGEADRKLFHYVLMGGMGSLAVYCAKTVIHTFVLFMAPAADVVALAKIEIKLSSIPEGKNVTFKWRGKPLFVRHRTPEEIAKEQAVDISSLRDPQHDKDRAKVPEWLVVIGVCTHLGCVPISHQGEWGGYYCPCHGSHYDASGRIRKGPAPLNLEVPPHEFNDDILVVG